MKEESKGAKVGKAVKKDGEKESDLLFVLSTVFTERTKRNEKALKSH